jgi:hypothetical protein
MALISAASFLPASAETNWRLMCAVLGGDLSEPGQLAAFRRCLTTHDPKGEMIRQNIPGHGGRMNNPLANLNAPLDRPNAAPPAGYGRSSRSAIAQAIQQFQLVDNKVVYIVATDGRLWRSTLGTKDAHVLGQAVSGFRVTEDGALYELSSSGDLFREGTDGSHRTLVDQAVADFTPVEGGIIYVRGSDGKLWRETGNQNNRALVDRQVTAYQPAGNGVIYVLTNDQKLWREGGGDRKLVASSIAGFQYFSGGDTFYVLTGASDLWRRSGSHPAEKVDSNVVGAHAVNANLVFVLSRDGRLWRDDGDRDHAQLVDHNVMASLGGSSFQVTDAEHVLVIDKENKLWAEKMPAVP